MATTENGIYYPNDYNSAADIPSDLKKMAESIDKNVQDNKYNDEPIKQDIQEINEDISDIKSNQTTQNDLLERTQSALINITTPKSSNINVKDSSDLNAKVDVYGISRQKTRSGKNKWVNKIQTQTVNGITVTRNQDGSLTFNGTATAVTTFYFETDTKGTVEFKDGERYTISDINSGESQIYQTCIIANYSPATEGTRTITVVTTRKANSSNSYIRFASGTVLNNYTIKPQIEPGEVATSYEQYGASPSPEYPSEIENVTGDINIKIYNKNLLDLTKCGFNNCVKNEDGSVRSNINNDYYATITTSQLNDFILQNKGKSLTFSFEGISTKTIGFFILCKRANSDSDYFETNKTGNSITMQIPEDLESLSYIQIRWNRQNTTFTDTTTVISNIQLELNNAKTDFVEHKEQTITFPLAEGQKLYNGDYPASDGIHHVRKQRELDGTENWLQFATFNQFYITLNNTKANNNQISCMSTHFKAIAFNTRNTNSDKECAISESGILAIFSKDYTTISDFKSYLAQQKEAGTPVILEYELAEEEIEPYTPEQQEAYNQLQNVLPYKPVTNVFTDKALLEFKYIADTKTYVDNEINSIKEQLNTINELLSTSNTSALLLNNLQTDLESEVL